MPAIVIPYRGDAKRRLSSSLRAALAVAMLGDVVEAAAQVGRVLVVTDDASVVPSGAEIVGDPGAGLGAAVAAGLERVEGPALVVNADLPGVTPEARRTLAAPRFPLPIRRKSLPPKRRASSQAKGTDPMQ